MLKSTIGLTPKDFLWRIKFGYKQDLINIDVRWATVFTHGIIKVPLNILRAPIVTSDGTQLMPIEDTPHYPWIKSIVEGCENLHLRDRYSSYLENYFPDDDKLVGLAQVIALVSSFKAAVNYHSIITIVTQIPVRYQGSFYIVIYDGVHRAAIAKALGHEFIKCRLVAKRINRNDFESRIHHDPNTMS